MRRYPGQARLTAYLDLELIRAVGIEGLEPAFDLLEAGHAAEVVE
jgi:hypothetical protein